MPKPKIPERLSKLPDRLRDAVGRAVVSTDVGPALELAERIAELEATRERDRRVACEHDPKHRVGLWARNRAAQRRTWCKRCGALGRRGQAGALLWVDPLVREERE